MFKSPLVFLDGTVEDAVKLIQPERHFDIGPDVQEREVWMDVVSRNEYQLPPMFNDKDVILDIGANSGAFSYACMRRGQGWSWHTSRVRSSQDARTTVLNSATGCRS